MRLLAAAVFVVLLPGMAIAGVAWDRASRIGRWARGIIRDTTPEKHPRRAARKLWDGDQVDQDDNYPWL